LSILICDIVSQLLSVLIFYIVLKLSLASPILLLMLFSCLIFDTLISSDAIMHSGTLNNLLTLPNTYEGEDNNVFLDKKNTKVCFLLLEILSLISEMLIVPSKFEASRLIFFHQWMLFKYIQTDHVKFKESIVESIDCVHMKDNLVLEDNWNVESTSLLSVFTSPLSAMSSSRLKTSKLSPSLFDNLSSVLLPSTSALASTLSVIAYQL